MCVYTVWNPVVGKLKACHCVSWSLVRCIVTTLPKAPFATHNWLCVLNLISSALEHMLTLYRCRLAVTWRCHNNVPSHSTLSDINAHLPLSPYRFVLACSMCALIPIYCVAVCRVTFELCVRFTSSIALRQFNLRLGSLCASVLRLSVTFSRPSYLSWIPWTLELGHFISHSVSFFIHLYSSAFFWSPNALSMVLSHTFSHIVSCIRTFGSHKSWHRLYFFHFCPL